MSDFPIAAVEGAYTPFETTLSFDWPSPPLSMNDRLHFCVEAKRKQAVKLEVLEAATRLPELGRCRITMTWFVTDKRVRDVENPVATLKVVCDALVDAGIVPDDRPAFMEKSMPIIQWVDKKAGGTAHIEFRIERMP